ncbi:hypothetical protein AMTR_s00055p00227100 [Amborella trichopoda]|uniref:Glutamate receptor n=1 Tax=Amborella trichopoda TaxID=13333 RepID=U5DD97_AMBTC|nr:hypothetical protein AMTR_s00055p00227100 [Amborella trichopoda]
MKAGFLQSVLKEMRAGFLLSSLLLSLFHSSFGLNEDGFNETKGARDVRVGVVLAMDSVVGRVSNSCIAMAIEDFYNEHPNFNTRLTISWRDSGGDVIKAASASVDLMKHEKVQAIIGPQTSGEAEFLANLGDKSQVPVLSFSATSPSLCLSSYAPYFVRGAVNDAAQAKPIAALLKAYGWKQAVAICEDSKFKSDFFPHLRDALEEIGSRLQYKSILPTFASEELIGQELYKLMTMQTRVFIVHMSSPLASQLFQQAQEIGMMSKDYAWIISDELASLLSSMDPSAIASMQGVLAVKTYIPKSQRLANFITRWKHFYSAENTTEFKVPDLNVFGLRAYDMTWVLALAVQKSGTAALPFQKQSTEEEIGNFTDLSNLGISPSGPSILRAILGTTFKGLAWDIRFINGELKASTFQVINIVKEGIRVIGFWSPVSGLSPVAERTQENKKKDYTANMADLRPVTWPGETAVVPKGWVIPTNSKKLRIGVPIKRRYQEFVKVERDPATGRLQVTGFSIDVFVAVMEVLPYSLPYEFLPFADSEGKSAGSYNDMINQVVQGKYDAVVGDITIFASRSNQVDFTPPYTSAGVSMIVPLQKEKRSKSWAFLEPLTWELWVITTCLFFFMAFVFWVLEHRINENFRGPPIEQLGNALYFSFSSPVFAHRDTTNGNMGRFVLIMWLFVVLILTSSYTANVASILTVEQLQPTVVDIETLINNGDFIGYQNNSCVEGLLVRSGFLKSKLMPYDTPNEYAEALSRGSSNGGVAAIFDEVPTYNYLCLLILLSIPWWDQFLEQGASVS